MRANRGEWAELFIGGWSVSKGLIHLVDGSMGAVDGGALKVLGARREGAELTCWRNDQNHQLELRDREGKLVRATSLEQFQSDMGSLLRDIKTKKGSSLDSAAGGRILPALGFNQIREGAGRKTDLELVLHNHLNGRKENVCFSVKSLLSSSPTLLNASQASTLRMEVIGISWEEAKHIQKTVRGTMARVQAVLKSGGLIIYHSIPNPIFLANLRMIDEACPVILGELVNHFAMGAGADSDSLVRAVMRDEEFVRRNSVTEELVKVRHKRFLTAAASGMTPSTKWSGTQNAKDGLLILGRDEEVYCLSLGNRDQYETYLYENTKFDSPSPNRFPTAKMIHVDGKVLMELSFQIRWAPKAKRATKGK